MAISLVSSTSVQASAPEVVVSPANTTYTFVCDAAGKCVLTVKP